MATGVAHVTTIAIVVVNQGWVAKRRNPTLCLGVNLKIYSLARETYSPLRVSTLINSPV